METVQNENTSNTGFKSNNTNFDENPILTIVKDMIKWIIPITAIGQDSETGYQIICDNYYEYINQLNNVNKNLNWTESAVKKIILSELNGGINNCPMWVTNGKYMAHFNNLRRTLNDMKTELEKTIIAEMEANDS